MIDTEFLRDKGPSPDLERAWSCVGRFLWGFAIVEADVNEIFVERFNFNAAASLMFTPLDLRKKLALIGVGLKDRDIPQLNDILKRVHKLADIRNVIAHFSFGPQIGGEGIYFDYVNQSGEMRLPHPSKTAAEDLDTTITYTQLDYYDSEARRLSDALQNLQGSFTPIADVTEPLARDIAAIIAASDNVVVFPARRG